MLVSAAFRKLMLGGAHMTRTIACHVLVAFAEDGGPSSFSAEYQLEKNASKRGKDGQMDCLPWKCTSKSFSLYFGRCVFPPTDSNMLNESAEIPLYADHGVNRWMGTAS
jgi:hypothetical protein